MIMNLFLIFFFKSHSKSSHNDINEHMTLNKIFGSGPPSPFVIVVEGTSSKRDTCSAGLGRGEGRLCLAVSLG